MSTTIEILQAYPLGTLEVEVGYHDGHKPERGTLLGLMLPDKPMKGRSAKVLFADGLARWVEAEALTAVLRPFSALCTPLEDGTVPAVEVAKLLPDAGKINFEGATGRLLTWQGGHYIEVVSRYDRNICTLYPNEFGLSEVSMETVLRVTDYLRKNHFAVGLTPAQFIEK